MSGEMRHLKRGQTLTAERERAESESERMLARKRMRRKNAWSVVIVILMIAVLVLLAYMAARAMVSEAVLSPREEAVEGYVIKAEIADETGAGKISARVKQYIGQIEQDFLDAGYVVKRVVLPAGTSRELYVDLEGVATYFKVTIDRGTAESVEDVVRMLRYLKERELAPAYVDVRVEGKAYYK